MDLKLISIVEDRDAMAPFLTNAFCEGVFEANLGYYRRIGYQAPWVGYFAHNGATVLGVGGYKGGPKEGSVEIAYGTVPGFEGQGVATEVCRLLTIQALEAEPGLMVRARTLMEENASTRILRKNGYIFQGVVFDEEDGSVWEWHFAEQLNNLR